MSKELSLVEKTFIEAKYQELKPKEIAEHLSIETKRVSAYIKKIKPAAAEVAEAKPPSEGHFETLLVKDKKYKGVVVMTEAASQFSDENKPSTRNPDFEKCIRPARKSQ